MGVHVLPCGNKSCVLDTQLFGDVYFEVEFVVCWSNRNFDRSNVSILDMSKMKNQV